jgi:hypothetical protein
MPSYIIKLGGKYLEWSTISDAPNTYGMDLDEFKDWYIKRELQNIESDLKARLRRVEKYGTSLNDTNKQLCMDFLDVLISENRCGPNEEPLTKSQIIEAYCKGLLAKE